MNTLTYVTSKLGKVQPKTRAIAAESLKVAQDAGYDIRFMWGMSAGEHSTGLALDLMVPNGATGRPTGDVLAKWATENAARLGIVHVLWRQRKWRGPMTKSSGARGVWLPMEDRGSVTENHYDHLHILFAAGDYIPPGPPTSFRLGDRGDGVKALQTRLNIHGATLTVDGSYGPATEAAVKAFQKVAGILIDGIAGPMTLVALGQSPAALNPPPAPITSKEPAMVLVQVKGLDEVYMSNGFARRHITPASALADWQRALRDQGGTGTVTKLDTVAQLDTFGPLDPPAPTATPEETP